MTTVVLLSMKVNKIFLLTCVFLVVFKGRLPSLTTHTFLFILFKLKFYIIFQVAMVLMMKTVILGRVTILIHLQNSGSVMPAK